jgi:pyrimidine operon attenuation protein / uracil phosphoribosyltransferase
MEHAVGGTRTCLYEGAELDAVVDGMVWQAARFLKSKKRVLIVGILRRGAPLADLLHDRLVRDFALPNMQVIHLKVKRYGDDLTLLFPDTKLTETAEQALLDLTDTTVLVVDDVLYQGHSLLVAMEYLVKKHPTEIRAAVLVDRGSCKLPVKADIVGVKLEIAPSDVIECNVPPYEPEFKIELLKLN